MKTPAEVKFALERRLLELASDGGPVPAIVGLHSVTVENDTVFCGFDIVPDPTGAGILFFEFELPALVSRDDLRAFGEWLASLGYGGTLH
jgi:hypothetical protein